MKFMHRMIVPVSMNAVDDVDETFGGTSADVFASSMKPVKLVPNSTTPIRSMYL